MNFNDLSLHALARAETMAEQFARGQGEQVLAEIDAAAGLPAGAAYCAATMVACFKMAGHCPWLGDGAMDWVPSLLAWGTAQGIRQGPPGYTPAAGDLVIFGGGDHVGIVRVGATATEVPTIEGNTSAAGNGGPTGIYRRMQYASAGWISDYIAWPAAAVPGFPGPAT